MCSTRPRSADPSSAPASSSPMTTGCPNPSNSRPSSRAAGESEEDLEQDLGRTLHRGAEYSPPGRPASAVGRHAAVGEGAQQPEAAGEHHVAVRRRVLERQRAAGEQGAARPGGEERQRRQVARLRRAGRARRRGRRRRAPRRCAASPARKRRRRCSRPGPSSARVWCSNTPARRPSSGDHADRVAVADVDEHGVGRRPPGGRRRAPPGRCRRRAPARRRRARRRAPAAARSRVKRGRRVGGRVEEVAERPALVARPPARSAKRKTRLEPSRAEAVVLDGDGDGVEARLHAEQRERGAQRRRRRGRRSARRTTEPAGRRPSSSSRPRLADHARAEGADLVQVVGEGPRRLLGGDEGVAGGEVRLHGAAVGAAAHGRPREHAPSGRAPSLRRSARPPPACATARRA